jgi:tRNA-dihydrouridine synthase A
LAQADRWIFGGSEPAHTRHEIARAYAGYVEAMYRRGVPLYAMVRHLLGLFAGEPGARAFRRFLSENAHRPSAEPALLRHALTLVPELSDKLAEAG